MACAPAQIPHRFDRDFCIGQRISYGLMLDDRMNASTPFNPSEVQGKLRAASAAGSDATGCSAIVAVMLTIWPEPARSIQVAAFCERWKNPQD